MPAGNTHHLPLPVPPNSEENQRLLSCACPTPVITTPTSFLAGHHKLRVTMNCAPCPGDANMRGAMRILIVEDEKRVAQFLRKGFEAETMAVDVAHDGADGADLARANDYDAIVLDLMLPGKDGIE